MDAREGAFFSFEELLAVFPRLKEREDELSAAERRVLYKMEKILYGQLSIQEIENRLGGIA
ncbi:MAG: hypothetical protein LBD31_09820 [Treponema sp.]|jgi:hypothetical protein|nr:hypothetical protein [Treponema sp.]